MNNQTTILPVILSGGAGTRLWPLSRELYPKQLLPLVGEHTMLQETVERLAGMSEVTAPLIVCNEAHRFMVAEQLREIDVSPAAIILEPCGRNTAPAVAVAALEATARGEDPLLLVLPADHVISAVDIFQETVRSGVALAGQGKLVTFGIVPDKPETGYGYIRAGASLIEGTALGNAGGKTAYEVAAFVEKPDQQTAQHYVASGDYFWNSGMFLLRASSYLEELERLAPEMLAACRKSHAGIVQDLCFSRLAAADFAVCPSDSIDYAVMEKTQRAAVVPLDAGWSDVGSWLALWEVSAQDEAGNVKLGDVLTVDSRNCYMNAENRMIAAVGVEDHVIVETADAVLVAHKDRVQDVKKIVEHLKAQKRDEAMLHRKVNRPWGTYECIDQAERFQVKRITVNPGATLSSQMHHHRAEHWVVVRGTAKVTKGDEIMLLSENQSTYIPIGVTHRLENPGKIPLELIEVQSGSYLGEDDIVRFEDHYGRS